MKPMTIDPQPKATLKRVLGLPLLIFYGVGVTIGAGIFALLGEVIGLAGDFGPLAFLVACAIAGTAAVSYALLSSEFPRAAGEAVYINLALGDVWAKVVGLSLCFSAVLSSAVISIAFAGYLGELVPVPSAIAIIALLLLLASVACLGVRESVVFAAALTIVEVGILGVLIYSGRHVLMDSDSVARLWTLPASIEQWSVMLSAAVIAFFAFIGFEDIVNMAEETVSAHRVVPQAVLTTLLITALIYVAVAIIASALPDRVAFVSSDAPLAYLYERVTGNSGDVVAILAVGGMVNGILVQIVMASRVIYGMSRDGLLPRALASVHPKRRTPVRAIAIIAILILVLALGFPLVNLAKLTSALILFVFTLVNLSLWLIGRQDSAPLSLRRWRYWGLFSALSSGCLLIIEGARMLSG